MAQVTFDDKVATRESNLPRENSITAEDINEIKSVINENEGLIPDTPNIQEVLEQGNEASSLLAFISGVLQTVITPAGIGGQVSGSPLWAIDSATGAAILQQLMIGVFSISPSAIFQVNSTTKGALLPRQTEAEMNAISSPVIGLQLYNTTRNEPMFYHSVFGWLGGSSHIAMVCGTTPTVTTGTSYFSMAGGLATRATIGGLAIKPNKKGKIISANFTRFIAGTLGNRSFSLYVRINDTTDYLVATQASTATETFFSNAAMNTTGILVDITDSIVMKLVVSGGTTDSANVLFFGNLLIR